MVCGMIKHKKQKKLTRANFQLKKKRWHFIWGRFQGESHSISLEHVVGLLVD